MYNKVKYYRELAGFTQVELACKADVSVRHLQAIEAGSHVPRVKLCRAIANALYKGIDEVFPDESIENTA